jgi:phage terminase large subunit GpA-like protein
MHRAIQRKRSRRCCATRPCLKGVVSEAKSKDGANTILQKQFPGGSLSLVGANSPRGFRRVSRRVVLFDEVDGYPPSAGTEGDQIKLGH